MIGEATGGDVKEPAARIGGHAFHGPLRSRGDQRVLHRVLGGGEILVPSCEGAEHLRRQLAQQVPDGPIGGLGGHTSLGISLMTWRTSIGMFSGAPPGPGAAEAFAASAYARSGDSTSTIQ